MARSLHMQLQILTLHSADGAGPEHAGTDPAEHADTDTANAPGY